MRPRPRGSQPSRDSENEYRAIALWKPCTVASVLTRNRISIVVTCADPTYCAGAEDEAPEVLIATAATSSIP